MKKSELVVALAVNYPITGVQAEDILEVLGSVTQYILQQGGTVELPGIGTLSVNEKNEATFAASARLQEILTNPDEQVRIEHVKGIPSGELYTGDMTIYKHKVNVC
jgi:nucleoid DNA-binding protein